MNDLQSRANEEISQADLEQTPVVSSDKPRADLSHSWYKEGFKIANDFQSRYKVLTSIYKFRKGPTRSNKSTKDLENNSENIKK